MESKPVTYIIFGFLILILGCGTGPDTLPLKEGWVKAGLEGYRISMLQREGDFIYAGTFRGLFRHRADESNLDWQFMGFEQHRIYDIIVLSSQMIIVAISEPNFNSGQTTLYLTTNGGATRTDYQNGFGGPERYTWVEQIEQDPTKPEILYALRGGLFARSTDMGKSWELGENGRWDGWGGSGEVMKTDPNRPGTVWGGGVNAYSEPMLFKTPDYGITFSAMGNYQYNEQGALVETVIFDLVIHSSHSDSVLIGEGTATSSGNGIKRTDDGGQNWTLPYDKSPIFAIAKDPLNENMIFATGVNQDSTLYFITSPDFGINWTSQEKDNTTSGLYSSELLADILQGWNVLYFGTNEGIYRYLFQN